MKISYTHSKNLSQIEDNSKYQFLKAEGKLGVRRGCRGVSTELWVGKLRGETVLISPWDRLFALCRRPPQLYGNRRLCLLVPCGHAQSKPCGDLIGTTLLLSSDFPCFLKSNVSLTNTDETPAGKFLC